ncbi:MAG TPA: hypothetical protein VFQ37_05920 [Mycobacterium sp.]|nr:hypothetical protein [Mycobacterium sp.]
MDRHTDDGEWTVARAVAPPPQPECDDYQRALGDALARLDLVLADRWEDDNPPGVSR